MKIRNIYITVVLVLVPLFLTTLGNAATRTIHAEWNSVSISGLAGFRLYQENSQRCEIQDPDATSIDCQVDFDGSETWFTLTYFLVDGTESAHSAPIPYTFTSSLTASISADVVSGVAPLAVEFDATASTGNIVSYQWMFGDGGTATGPTASHTFTSQGSYTVTLTVYDGIGNLTEETLTIIASADTGTTNASPTAALSSSSGIGETPFQVTLDAGRSSDSDGQIVSYQWDLGDGSSAVGAQVSHTYTTAGTYNPAVTVTDDGGLTDTASTPIIVESSSSINTPPTADINASVTGGPPPLKVSFDAGSSTDADGTIASYYWDFGDGSTGNGKTADHTFEQSGTYTIELIVTDDDGYISQPATLQVIVDEDYQANRADIIHIINLLLLD